MSFTSFIKHLGVFVIIEIIFVLLLFREFPETNLYTLIGILHLSYWIILVLAGWLRERSRHVWQRFCCTYVPIVYHLAIHLYAGRAAIEIHSGEEHDEHSLTWMIIWALLLWGLIRAGEWYLHRALHCQTHHASAHAHCEDDCEHHH